MNRAKEIINLVERIEDDTPIITYAVAETVISNAIDHLDKSGDKEKADALYEKQPEYVQQLVDRAEKEYQTPQGKKRFGAKGNAGRNSLYAFMQHWLSSMLLKDFGIEMPQSFAVKGKLL